MPEQRQFGGGTPSTAYYAPPPGKRPNYGAMFLSTLLQTRNQWAMEVFRERLKQSDPTRRAALLVDAKRADNERAREWRMALAAQLQNAQSNTSLLEAYLKAYAQIVSPDIAGRHRVTAADVGGVHQERTAQINAAGDITVANIGSADKRREIESNESLAGVIQKGSYEDNTSKTMLSEIRDALSGNLSEAQEYARLEEIEANFEKQVGFGNVNPAHRSKMIELAREEIRRTLMGRGASKERVDETMTAFGESAPQIFEEPTVRGAVPVPGAPRLAPGVGATSGAAQGYLGHLGSAYQAGAADLEGQPQGGSQSFRVSGMVPQGAGGGGAPMPAPAPGGRQMPMSLEDVLGYAQQQRQQAQVPSQLDHLVSGPSAVDLAQEELNSSPGLGGFFSPLPVRAGERRGLLDSVFGGGGQQASSMTPEEEQAAAFAEARAALGREHLAARPRDRERSRARAEWAAARQGLSMTPKRSLDELADELQLSNAHRR